MKPLAIILLLVSATAFAQPFEGKITYQNEVKSKIPNIPDQQFMEMVGPTQEYYIKDGNYKSVLSGNFIQWQLYINNDNRLYMKLSNNEDISYFDASTNLDSVLSTTLNKGIVEILGYTCDELILESSSGVQKFYFSSSIGIDASLFEKHQFGNFAAYVNIAKAVPLKIILDNPQMFMTSTASSVEKMGLEESDFALPKDAVVVKSPY